jgi:uncharacterized protein
MRGVAGSQLTVDAFPVVVLTGARQVGKTTLLRHLFPDYNYVSLDLYSESAFALQDMFTGPA